jgi:hypothetical protein
MCRSGDAREGAQAVTPEFEIPIGENVRMRLGLSHPGWMGKVRGATAVVFAVALVVTCGEASADAVGRRLLLAGFEARSYRPGQVAVLRIDSSPVQRLTLRLFLAGGAGTAAVPAGSRDPLTFGQAVTEQVQVRRPAGSRAWLVHIRLGSDWPSGDYVAHLGAPGTSDYAPFVLRPRRLGSAPVLVVEPTNTWQAYNVTHGDSWYLDPAVHVIDLTRPYAGVNVRGQRVPKGLPDQFFRLDLGFLRWYWRNCFRADLRDLGRPEAALVGAQYVGWDESRFPNHPYRVLNTRHARWLFAGTGLHHGSRLGQYGIEIDQRDASSPPDTKVLATIPNDFGTGKSAEMTIYRRGHATVFDAGVLNFAASAHWPQISRLVTNLWTHLSGEPQEQPTCP